jgi:hypothetical protein
MEKEGFIPAIKWRRMKPTTILRNIEVAVIVLKEKRKMLDRESKQQIASILKELTDLLLS